MRKKIRFIEIKIRQFIWLIKNIGKPDTYDEVIYKGDKYWIKSSLTGYNIWNLYKNEEKNPTYFRIKGDDLKVKRSFKKLKNTIKLMMRFQKNTWQQIDMENRIGSRLTFYNSEDIKYNFEKWNTNKK